jgi:hypothetical protein
MNYQIGSFSIVDIVVMMAIVIAATYVSNNVLNL